MELKILKPNKSAMVTLDLVGILRFNKDACEACNIESRETATIAEDSDGNYYIAFDFSTEDFFPVRYVGKVPYIRPGDLMYPDRTSNVKFKLEKHDDLFFKLVKI